MTPTRHSEVVSAFGGSNLPLCGPPRPPAPLDARDAHGEHEGDARSYRDQSGLHRGSAETGTRQGRDQTNKPAGLPPVADAEQLRPRHPDRPAGVRPRLFQMCEGTMNRDASRCRFRKVAALRPGTSFLRGIACSAISGYKVILRSVTPTDLTDYVTCEQPPRL